MDAEIAKLLPLARHIARDFSNIPGLDLPEIEIQAQEALAAAGRQFDPEKGDKSFDLTFVSPSGRLLPCHSQS